MNNMDLAYYQDSECRLLSGLTSAIAHGVLGCIALCVLLSKRMREIPKRPSPIFLLDLGKQVFGMGAAHICGLLVAMIVHIRSDDVSECAWYLVVYLLDTTLGVSLSIKMHDFLVCQAMKNTLTEDSQSLLVSRMSSINDILGNCGDYGTPIHIKYWSIQTAAWVGCVILARLACGFTAVISAPIMHHLAASLDVLFQGHSTMMLFFVMMVGPLILNSLQLLFQDAALKHHDSK